MLGAVRETLAQLSETKQNSPEVAPLFQVLQTYGDPTVLADLENSVSKFGYYSTMALAGMPSGEGIPTLIRMAQERGASVSLRNEFALQMLAQVSAQYPDASAALVEQARLNQISETAWTKIATGLAGDQYQFSKNLTDNSLPLDNLSNLKTYHVQAGNQNFYSTPVTANGSEEQINQRRARRSNLLAVNSNPRQASCKRAPPVQKAVSRHMPRAFGFCYFRWNNSRRKFQIPSSKLQKFKPKPQRASLDGHHRPGRFA
jgi:hypothetical protein